MARAQEDDRDAGALFEGLLSLGRERAPFAVEGAAMALEARDAETGAEGIPALLIVVDDVWIPFVELGVGCSLARRSEPPPERAGSLDGYGFHVGLFAGGFAAAPRDVGERFFRGLGRATWFSTGGDAHRSVTVVSRLGAHAELWRGLATACVFAGDPKGHAAALREVGSEWEASLRAGASEAMRIWCSLAPSPPARVERAVADLAAFDEGSE